MDADNKILLTIAVPTYNRSAYLQRSLSSILGQTAKYDGRIEVIVFDNCSTDDTASVVHALIADGNAISFTVNPSNVGPDGNFLHCFNAARGKYFLLFSDDDVLLDGAIDKLFPLLEGGDYGIVYLDVYFFNKDPLSERPHNRKGKIRIYQDHLEFVRAINIWFTFISSNIINKELVDPAIRLEDFANSNLQQLGWTFPSLFNAKQNMHYNEYLVAAQMDNSGGYKFCEVFGPKMNRIFDIFTNSYGYDDRYFKVINRIILKRHLSKYILSARKDFGSYHEEDFIEILHPVFSSYPSYWIFIYPSIKWPLFAARLWCKVCRRLAKMTGTL